MITSGEKIAPPRILVVEDDSEMRNLLVYELLDEGYLVSEAVDGEDAALKLAHGEFDLVITDLIMPKTSGLDLLSEVRNIYPRVPAILITAFGDWSSLTQAYEKGACNFICKPFKMNDLKDAVRKALKKDQSH
jgi:two-component system response regulator PilR (NtrC family)